MYGIPQPTPPRRKRMNIFTILGILCILAAVGISGYNMIEGIRAGRASQAMLEELLPSVAPNPLQMSEAFPASVSAVPENTRYSDSLTAPETEIPVAEVKNVPLIGVLRVPTLNRALPVISETSDTYLKEGPCRYHGSPYTGNFIIGGHNFDQHFGNLRDLRYGDYVVFTDINGNEFIYQVRQIETIPEEDVDAMVYSFYDFTLFTCTLDGFSRIAVRCDRVG